MNPQEIELKEICLPEENNNIGWKNYKFYWRGRECPSTIVSGAIGKRRQALEMISSDLSSCWTYLCIMANDNESVIQSALYKTMVVTYAKCFVSGKERGFSLLETTTFKDVKEEIYKSHQFMMKARHRFIAHSDDLSAQKSEICIVQPPEGHQDLKPHVVATTMEYVSPTGGSFVPYMHVVSYVMDYVQELIKKCNERLISEQST